MVSAFDRSEVMSQLNGLELEGFLVSPVAESQLLDTIKKVFGARPAVMRMGCNLRRRRARLKGRHVLLVDDNDFNCDIAGEVLAELGISFSVATNGREAVTWWRRKHLTWYSWTSRCL